MAENGGIDFRIDEFAWEDVEKYKEDIIEKNADGQHLCFPLS